MKTMRPKAKIAGMGGMDLVQVLPIASDKRVFFVEMYLSSGEIVRRVLDTNITADQDVDSTVDLLISMAGLQEGARRLFTLNHFLTQDTVHPLDSVHYIFIIEDAAIVKTPKLPFTASYSLKAASIPEFEKLVKEEKIENFTYLEKSLSME